MHQALLGEFGARAIYGRLARQTRDAELTEVLSRFYHEEFEQIETLRGLLRTLGATPSARSRRRALSAWVVVQCARVGGMSLALRLCFESEQTIQRWYNEYAHYFAQADERGHAAVCQGLALTKERHARILSAWVEH